MKRTQVQHIFVRVRLRPVDGKDLKKSGYVFLQIGIGRKTDRIPLGFQWPVEHFDKKGQRLLSRFAKDQQCYDYNLLITEALAKANNIVVGYRLSGIQATLRGFKDDYAGYGRDRSLCEYMRSKIQYFREKEAFVESSLHKYSVVLHRMEDYGREKDFRWRFAEVNRETLEEHLRWMRKNNRFSHNTMVGELRIIRKFLRLAGKEGVHIDQNISDIKFSYQDGDRIALTVPELKRLKALYSHAALTDVEKEVLRMFLFACHTGLRFSDCIRITGANLIRNRIKLVMYKTRRFGKHVEMEVSDYVLQLIGIRQKGELFRKMDNSLVNKTLGRISVMAGFPFSIKFSFGRDTFGTIMACDFNTDLRTVQLLMGHSTILVTQKYLRVRQENIVNSMAKFDKI